MAAKLTDKQKRFCDVYLANGMNATQAYISVYGVSSENVAAASSAKLLRNAKVSEYLGQRQNKVAQKLELTFERHALEYARLAYSDVRKLYNEDGTLKPVHEWDDDTAAAVSSIEVDELKEGFDVVGQVKKVKLHSKTTALADAGKHLGFFEKDNSQRNAGFDLSGLSATEKLQFLQLLTKANSGA